MPMTSLEDVERSIRSTIMFLSATRLSSPIIDNCIKKVMERVKKYGEECAEDALEGAPDCDSCNRIDPDNPPERDNEGYL